MKWTNSEDIGIALFEKFPAVDPLTVRFTDLREKVIGPRRVRRRPESVERTQARGYPDGLVRRMEGKSVGGETSKIGRPSKSI